MKTDGDRGCCESMGERERDVVNNRMFMNHQSDISILNIF
jgi:hypothetical protein